MRSSISAFIHPLLLLITGAIFLLPTQQIQSQIPAVNSSATDIAWSPDETKLAVVGNFGVVLYSADTLQPSQILTTKSTIRLAWNSKGTLLATIGYAAPGYIVNLWNTQDSQPIAAIPVSSGPIRAVALSPDDLHIAVATYDEGVYVYEVDTQRLSFILTSPSPIVDAAWSPNGTYIAAVGGGELTYPETQAMLSVWRADTGALEFSIDLTEEKQLYAVSAMDWHPDSTKIALGTGYGDIPVLDISSQNIAEGYAGPVQPLTFVGWSPDGIKFVGAEAGTLGSTLSLWDASTFTRIWFVTSPSFDISYIGGAWKPDSSQLAVLSNNITDSGSHTDVQILDVASGTEIAITELPPVDPSVVLNGNIWDDLNQDGTHQPGESPLNNIVINLLDANGTVIESTVSSIYGYYYFEVDPGTYIIEAAVSGYVLSPANQGDDTMDSDFDPETYRTQSVTLGVGESVTLDAGMYQITPDALTRKINACITENGIRNSLQAKINAEQWRAFINEVEAQRGKKIPEDCAVDLIEMAQYLLENE